MQRFVRIPPQEHQWGRATDAGWYSSSSGCSRCLMGFSVGLCAGQLTSHQTGSVHIWAASCWGRKGHSQHPHSKYRVWKHIIVYNIIVSCCSIKSCAQNTSIHLWPCSKGLKIIIVINMVISCPPKKILHFYKLGGVESFFSDCDWLYIGFYFLFFFISSLFV